MLPTLVSICEAVPTTVACKWHERRCEPEAFEPVTKILSPDLLTRRYVEHAPDEGARQVGARRSAAPGRRACAGAMNMGVDSTEQDQR